MLRGFNIFLDQLNAAPVYQIALAPYSRTASAMVTKVYSSKEAFVTDLQERLGFTSRAIERFLFNPNQYGVLPNHQLSNEDAAYFGWLPDLDRF